MFSVPVSLLYSVGKKTFYNCFMIDVESALQWYVLYVFLYFIFDDEPTRWLHDVHGHKFIRNSLAGNTDSLHWSKSRFGRDDCSNM